MSILPFRPIRGQSFTAYFTPGADYNYAQFGNSFVSKDGGVFTLATNTSTSLSLSSAKLVLTESEMDAEVVLVAAAITTASTTAVEIVTIFTMPQELSSLPTTNSTLHLRLMAMYQYLLEKREVTATSETLYKHDGSTTIGTSTLSDNGTTFSHGKVG